MKILVDELPYYYEWCPLEDMVCHPTEDDDCPRYWSKHKVCSKEQNQHECKLLKELRTEE